jgi:hypothetical protein
MTDADIVAGMPIGMALNAQFAVTLEILRIKKDTNSYARSG